MPKRQKLLRVRLWPLVVALSQVGAEDEDLALGPHFYLLELVVEQVHAAVADGAASARTAPLGSLGSGVNENGFG